MAAVYVCGFRDTIAGSVLRLLGRSHVPEDRRLRRMLGIGDDAKPSLFYEQYDLEPVFDASDTALIASSAPRGRVDSSRVERSGLDCSTLELSALNYFSNAESSGASEPDTWSKRITAAPPTADFAMASRTPPTVCQSVQA